MKMKCKRLVVLLMTMLMVSNSLQVTVSAEEGNLVEKNRVDLLSAYESEEKADDVIYQTMTYVNPIYADVVQSSELLTADENGVSVLSEENYCTTLEEAGAVMRQQMVDRRENVTVYYQTTDDNYSQYMKKISDEAMSHTGVPTEGDYLKFQYAGWNCSLSGNVSNDTYYLTLIYTVTYYTTADQETVMDNAVSELLEQLDLSGKPEYKKIKSVYDFICENVTYDYDNLEDDSYKLKFTAYAALVDKTAVCQGYAVLSYRLLEELDVDCRVISGTGNGGAHAWNIAGIDGFYYNLDSTWDAGRSSYSYFLKCDENFGDHIRNENYTDDAFTKAYPMGTEDYIYTEAEIVASGICGDNLTWTLDSDGLLTISGTGAMEDYGREYPWYSERESITSVTIESGVTGIEDYAFNKCSSMISIEIPDTVTSIGDYAFNECSSLTSINISDSVTNVGECAFKGCSSLTEINVEKENKNYSSIDGVLFDYGMTDLICCPGGKSGTYVVLDNVMSIREYAFYRCSSLTSIEIPDSVASIGDWAFSNCSSLTSIEIPDGVTNIGDDVFAGCSSLSNILLPDSVTSIGDWAFCECSSLTSILIPDGVTRIGDNAFFGCSSLTSILIPDGVTIIGYYVFFECSSLTSINIPDGVTCIGDRAFYRCESLTGISIPDSVTIIGDMAFQKCSSLISITFEGPAPKLMDTCFLDVTATAYYPTNDPSWTEEVKQNYGGTLTWVPKGTEEKEM